MKKKPAPAVWDRSHRSFFENFALDLQDFTNTGKLPVHGSQDANHSLELQWKRHERANLQMKYDFKPRGLFADYSPITKGWKDERYINHMECRTCLLKRSFFRDGHKVYENKKKFLFYQITTNVNYSDAAAEDLYTCPSCGAISQIKTLQKGCPYCGSCFEISELFPKITNHFFIEDLGKTSHESKRGVRRSIFLCSLVFCIINTICIFSVPEEHENLFQLLFNGILLGCLAGLIIGYIGFAFLTIGHISKNALKALPMAADTAGSRKRFVSQMRQYSPEFSYEYFSGKVVSLLKMIIYAENPQELPYYMGPPVDDLFSNIMDSSYTGAVALKHFQMQGDFACVTVNVYMENIYLNKKRFKQQKDIFRIYLMKNIRKPIDYNFSIERIQCKSCGRSFNAALQKNCPNCYSLYEIGDDDWIVVKISKI